MEAENMERSLEIPFENCKVLDKFRITIPEWIREQIKAQLDHEVKKGGLITIQVKGYIPPAGEMQPAEKKPIAEEI